MLSIVTSPHPSCSDSNKDLDLPGDVSHNVQAHPSNFSIRKYVFKSRSKDIRSNWPFREQLLQLCLDNGINDLLPPIEFTSLVKAQYSSKNKALVLDGGESKNQASEPDSSSVLDSLVVLSSNKEQLKNKCESKDLESNSDIVSNYMSSNACPVCKSFLSSSNTTLNAHIDQCLSSTKSSMTREDAGLNLRAKVKKKLMVDIYKTANHCTLEDLDRRNGTNWAATLAFIIPVNDVDHAADVNNAADVSNTADVNCARKPNDIAKDMRLGTKRTVPQLRNSREGNVGDIYVDSNGTKLLILSKCNDSSPVILNKNLKMKKHGKDLPLKKLISQSNNTKLLRNTILRRKINLDNELEHEDGFATANKVHSGEGSHEYKESNEENTKEPIKLGHWVRSKRSNLTRKRSRKFSSEGSKVVSINPNKKPSIDHTQQKSENTNVKRILVNHSKLFKTAASPKFKAMKVICSTLNELDKRNTNTQAANLISHSSTPESFSSRGSDLSKTTVDEQAKNFTGKCFKKRRSMLRCNNKRGGENDSNIINSGSHDSTDNFKSSMIQSSKFSKCQEKNIHCDLALNKEMRCSISRNESQVELPIYNDKLQCDDATNNEVVNRDIQISTDQPKKINHHGECLTNTYSFQDPSHCITSDGDTCVENTQENSSMTSMRATLNDKDCNLFVEMESSVLRVSTTPTISPSSPKVDDKIRDYVAHEDHKAKLSPKAWDSSCSCSEITNSNPFIKLPSFSSVNSSLESHNETVNLFQNQSAPVPILRLMGKDLVVSKHATMQNQSTTLCDEKEKFTCMGVSNHAGFRSYNNNLYQYHPVQATSHNYQTPVNHNQALPLPVVPQYHGREDANVSFNDISQGFRNSNIMPSQSVFSYFPSQSLYAPQVFSSTQRQTTEGTCVYHSPSSLYFASVLR